MENTPKKKGKVLIVEDDPLLIRIYQLHFKEVGYDSEVVTDGKQALEHVQASPPSIILLDLVMSNMDGFQFLEAYRRERLPQIPILVLSNLGEPEEIRRAKELGATEYIVKAHSDLNEIIARIDKYTLSNYAQAHPAVV